MASTIDTGAERIAAETWIRETVGELHGDLTEQVQAFWERAQTLLDTFGMVPQQRWSVTVGDLGERPVRWAAMVETENDHFSLLRLGGPDGLTHLADIGILSVPRWTSTAWSLALVDPRRYGNTRRRIIESGWDPSITTDPTIGGQTQLLVNDNLRVAVTRAVVE